ncbi:ribose/xylose/arabinose/galactoside ABC-type transport system permease subunit [Kaistia hirudinis]|uniref:Ribose/xylose/arabinose/galactoside ABC-type transport system permease subunit n=1 Tax=Kaistia hirudinis TaxID=1293440 RepID=A0A840AJS7_9HYPH|nr:ABC transporter permease [Kaistia hirudinis]MBB3929812.1 ribose/xylose/arabinose/galactoside ABC-type transport system permease subunit [Kaistia hirudinis]MBN9018142.1 ABC transporter permease [Hyphomicrobiales bacterium]
MSAVSGASRPQSPSALRKGFARLLRSRELGVFVPLLLISIFFAYQSPVFLTEQNLLNLLRQISLLGVMAIGATFVLIASEVDLSVGSVYGLSGIVTGLLITSGVSDYAALGAILVLGFLIGTANGLVTVYGRIPSFIATLGSLYLIRGLTLVITGGQPVTLEFDANADFLRYIAQGIVFGKVSMQVVILAVAAIIGYVLLHRSRFGFEIFAVGGNEKAAQVIGIRTGKVKILAFGIASLTGALCGAVNFGFIESVQPTNGQGLELDVIAAVIIGGTRLGGGQGSILGTLLGVLLIGVLRNGLVLLGVSAFWQTATIGAVVILAALASATLNRKRA